MTVKDDGPAAPERLRLSIIMPTLNSEPTLRRALEALARQSLPRREYEILVIDGGSTDDTRAIAASFGCRILENPRVLPELAKLIGLGAARGRYAMFLDSDEVLVSPTSLEDKLGLLTRHPDVRNVVTAGLTSPAEYPAINEYINRFGEPFSYFMYRLDGGDYAGSLAKRYAVDYADGDIVIARFRPSDVIPICDGGGHCFDLDYLKSIADIADVRVVPVVFALMAERTHSLGLVRGDYTEHRSTTGLRHYLRKIDWRIESNAYKETGAEGFVGRERLLPRWAKLKKFAFPVYALTLVGPLWDAVALTLRHRRPAFMMHAPLSVYVALAIIRQLAARALGSKPRITSYGG